MQREIEFKVFSFYYMHMQWELNGEGRRREGGKKWERKKKSYLLNGKHYFKKETVKKKIQ